MNQFCCKALLALCFVLFTASAQSQFLMDMIDTSKETGKGMLALYRKFDRIKIGGYIQPEFQFAQSKGIKSFEGGDFGPQVRNRFLLRRSRYILRDNNCLTRIKSLKKEFRTSFCLNEVQIASYFIFISIAFAAYRGRSECL